jgi:hypothetical protein
MLRELAVIVETYSIDQDVVQSLYVALFKDNLGSGMPMTH